MLISPSCSSLPLTKWKDILSGSIFNLQPPFLSYRDQPAYSFYSVNDLSRQDHTLPHPYQNVLPNKLYLSCRGGNQPWPIYTRLHDSYSPLPLVLLISHLNPFYDGSTAFNECFPIEKSSVHAPFHQVLYCQEGSQVVFYFIRRQSCSHGRSYCK